MRQACSAKVEKAVLASILCSLRLLHLSFAILAHTQAVYPYQAHLYKYLSQLAEGGY